jgi:hypothetical protein
MAAGLVWLLKAVFTHSNQITHCHIEYLSLLHNLLYMRVTIDGVWTSVISNQFTQLVAWEYFIKMYLFYETPRFIAAGPWLDILAIGQEADCA